MRLAVQLLKPFAGIAQAHTVGAGNLAVGSALVSVGWEYAFGRAIWAALTN